MYIAKNLTLQLQALNRALPFKPGSLITLQHVHFTLYTQVNDDGQQSKINMLEKAIDVQIK